MLLFIDYQKTTVRTYKHPSEITYVITIFKVTLPSLLIYYTFEISQNNSIIVKVVFSIQFLKTKFLSGKKN